MVVPFNATRKEGPKDVTYMKFVCKSTLDKVCRAVAGLLSMIGAVERDPGGMRGHQSETTKRR